jgi:hypothetical protein
MKTSGLLTPEELAARWDYTVETLANWRAQNKGPRFVKLADKGTAKAGVRYRLSDVEAYEKTRLVGTKEQK